MEFYTSEDCYNTVRPLYLEVQDQSSPKCVNLTMESVLSLLNYCSQTIFLEVENKYSKPMVWVGIYITLASLFCTLAMAADLLHGFRSKKLWFPCRCFTLNAASITVITVAMKLPVDLSSLMPFYLDQATKVGSLAFMCTMMANFMPSLASIDNKTLLANVIGLAILVITIIVNICIQISTGVIENSNYNIFTNFMILAYIYMALLFWLLIVLISSAITIPASKQILQFKYQATCKRTLNDQLNNMSAVEKLTQCVRKYWVMAESGSPQFVMTSTPLSYTCAIVCVISLVMEIIILLEFRLRSRSLTHGSDYKGSMIFIAITQSLGVVVGSIAPICRCFTTLNYNLFTKPKKNHFMVFKVEKYWIQKLCEWRESHVPFLSSASRSRTLVHNLKNLLLSLCISIQKYIVVSCKMIRLVPLILLISVMYCWKYLMAMLFTPAITSRIDDVNEDLSNCFLKLEDEMELGERTLKRISSSINHLIQKAEKKQHKDLLVLLETSTGFKGVENFDNDQVLPLTTVKLVNSWSLPIVSFTCIAIALPNIPKDVVDSLVKSVHEGLLLSHLMEESLSRTSEYGNIRRVTMTLWHEVEANCMWLENTLKKSAFKGKTSVEILEWFAKKAEEIVIRFRGDTNGDAMETTPKELIAANSMYRIAQTIVFNYQGNVEPMSQEELFALIRGMIADIFSASFTNLPRAIMMKCHSSAIEKREGSVEVAAKLFGRTKEIIKRLEVQELPSMDPDRIAFIDEWRTHLRQSIP